MLKRYTLLFVVILFLFGINKTSFAQNGWTVGGSVGVINLYGDVTDYESFDFDAANIGGALSIERKIGRVFVPQLQLTFGNLSDTKTYLDVQYETFYAEASIRAGFDLVGIFKENARLELVPFGGLAVATYSPTVTRVSSGEVIESDHINEGENLGLGTVFGSRLGYRFTPKWKVYTVLEMRYMFTDQVDGYRGLNLPDPEESSNDFLSYIGVGVGYTFGAKDKFEEEPDPLLAETENNEDQIVNGQFTHNNLPKSGVKLDLFDENDKKLASSTTDVSGNFKFKDLKPERNYIVKLSDEDKGLYNGGKVYIVNDDKERVALAEKPNYNTYTFTQMTHDEVEDLALLVEDKPSTEMSGVFVYEELPAAGVKVYLMDEAGNRIDSTVTRSDGSFKFSPLDPNREYFVKLDEKDAAKYAGADMFFLNEKDEPVLKASDRNDGSYAFKALDKNDIAALEPLTNDGGEMLYRKTSVQKPPVVDLGLDDKKDVADQQKVKDEPKVKPQPTGSVSFEKETIYFRHNSFWISENQQGTKGAVIAQKMKDNPNMRIRIEGWASNPGDDDYNLRLSQKRADRLKDLLVTKYGIKATRIEAVGKGEVAEKMSEEEARKARIIAIK